MWFNGFFMIEPVRLADDMYSWWLKTLEAAHIPVGFNQPAQVERDEELIYLNHQDNVLLMGFDRASLDERESWMNVRSQRGKRVRNTVPGLAFFALGVPDDSSYDSFTKKVNKALKGEDAIERGEISFVGNESLNELYNEVCREHLKGLPKDDRSKFNGTFAGAKAYLGQVTRSGFEYSGVLVRAPIVQIPTGKGGHVSEKLFVRTREYLFAPLTKVLSSLPKLDNRD